LLFLFVIPEGDLLLLLFVYVVILSEAKDPCICLSEGERSDPSPKNLSSPKHTKPAPIQHFRLRGSYAQPAILKTGSKKWPLAASPIRPKNKYPLKPFTINTLQKKYRSKAFILNTLPTFHPGG
jgi:hypothetical protein